MKYLTKCLCTKEDGTPCQFVVKDDPLNVAIVGQPDARIQRFIGTLMQHIANKHKPQMVNANQLMQFFFGHTIVCMFQSQDPALLETRKNFEAVLRRLMTPQPITDEQIDIALLAAGQTDNQAFRLAMRHLRDWYEGNLTPQPANAPESLLITP